MKWFAGMCLAGFMVSGAASCNPEAPTTITQKELVHRTQQLFDSVAIGDRTPWQKYIAPDAIFSDEKGRTMDKTALVEDVTPLPAGYSGTIKLINPQFRIVGNTAILSYDLDETESVFGQNMTARYHETDTWIQRNGEWQLVAGQVLRYYEDPAPGKADPKKLADYAGTYELSKGTELTVFAEGKDLFTQKAGKPKVLLIPEAPDIFFRKGVEGRYVFQRADSGKVDALLDRRNNEDVAWKRVK